MSGIIVKLQSVRCVVMRGGTTRGFFFQAKDLPRDPEARDRLLMAIVAGHDLRQVDGLGGADLLLSKVAVVWPSAHSDADVDCLFGSITPGDARIKYGANCGNLISAVALFAVEEGLCGTLDGAVRIYNPDSNTRVEASFLDQAWLCDHADQIGLAGMPATGIPLELAFIDPTGSIGGDLLPTGNAIDHLTAQSGKTVEASIVDSGALYVFVSSEELGLECATMPLEGQRRIDLLDEVEYLRAQAAVLTGCAATPAEASLTSAAVPKVALISSPTDYETDRGRLIKATDVHLLARIISSQSLHRAYAVTGAIATISAGIVQGSVVNRVVGAIASAAPLALRIGHPGGIMEPRIDWRRFSGSVAVERAYVTRTARHIMSGLTYLPNLPDYAPQDPGLFAPNIQAYDSPVTTVTPSGD